MKFSKNNTYNNIFSFLKDIGARYKQQPKSFFFIVTTHSCKSSAELNICIITINKNETKKKRVSKEYENFTLIMKHTLMQEKNAKSK